MTRKANIWSWVGIMVTIGLLIGYAYHRDLLTRYQHYQNTQREVRNLEQTVRERAAEEETLRRRIDAFEVNPIELEATVRRKEHLVREGERVYRVELPEESESSTP